MLSENVVFFIAQQLGARGVQFGLRVRSSALFNWLLQVLDFSIGFFFVLLLLVTAGLLFDGFHEVWGAPDFLAQLGQAHVVGSFSWTALCVTFVWVAMAVRVLFLARLFSQANQLPAQQQQQQQRQQQQQQPREVQVVARPQSCCGPAALDYGLFVLVGMTLLWVFPWPDYAVIDDAPPQWARARFLLLALILLFQLLQSTWAARTRLHRQVASIPVVTWSPLHHQAPCDGANGVTHVDVGSLHMAGLVSASAPHSQPIFLRQEAIDQFVWLRAFITGNHHVDTDGGRVEARVAHIEGPPGTGKSTITWAWACELARQQPVLWAHHPSDLLKPSTVALIAGGVVTSFPWIGESYGHLFNIAAWAGARVIVVDGVQRERAQLAADARVWSTADPLRRKAVTVSSAQLAIDGLTAREDAITFREIFSWASEDYAAACRAPGGDRFWQSVRRNAWST